MESWDNVTTALDTIFVTDRPSFENFSLIITPPKYSKVKKFIQEGNIAAIKTLKGSEILVDITSNRLLQTAFISLNKSKINMVTSYNTASRRIYLIGGGKLFCKPC